MNLGKWVCKKDVSVTLANKTLTLKKGCVIDVVKTNNTYGKVLVGFTVNDIDWIHSSFLKDFEKL